VVAVSLLEVRDVTKSFAGLHALRGVSLTVAKGEFLGIIGPNGAGKTTLFSIIAGQVPTTGSIAFDGEDVTGRRPDRLARAGLVRTFQLMRPFESMTVLDNVAVAAHAHHRRRAEARAAAADIVARVGLEQWIDSPAGVLPTAGLKRLELARALALRPRLPDGPAAFVAPRGHHRRLHRAHHGRGDGALGPSARASPRAGASRRDPGGGDCGQAGRGRLPR